MPVLTVSFTTFENKILTPKCHKAQFKIPLDTRFKGHTARQRCTEYSFLFLISRVPEWSSSYFQRQRGVLLGPHRRRVPVLDNVIVDS